MREDKAKADAQAKVIENKLAAVDSMQGQLMRMESEVDEAKKVAGQLQKLLSQGVLKLDEEGNLQGVNSQE